MGLFSKKKNEEVAIDELTPQIKTKLDELAQKGNQFEEEEQYAVSYTHLDVYKRQIQTFT